MSAIFISYRREDTEGHAGRLFEVLVERFGKDSVFMDVAGIEPGRDFRKAIDSNVADCGALLAVIGKGWLSAKNEAGLRRIDDPHDFVRLETVSALKRDIPVIPVLVHGAVMPRADQLPPELQELAFRNGVEVTHARWDSDVQLLTKALERYVNKSPARDAAAALEPPATPPTPVNSAASARSPAMKYLGIAGVVAALAAGGTALYQRNANEAAKNAEIQVKKQEAELAAKKAEADKAAAAQKEAEALKTKAEQEATARAAELRAQEDKIKLQSEALELTRLAGEKKTADVEKATQANAAREAELRAQEAKLKQQAEALTATRLAAEKKTAEAERLAKIEREQKLAAANKPPVSTDDPVKPTGTNTSATKPPDNTVKTTVTFINNGERAADVFWLNFQGKEQRYFTLPPGKTFIQDTYVSHQWVVRDSQSQRQLATAVGVAQPATVRIGEQRAAAGPGTDGRKVTRVTFKDAAGNTAGHYRQAAPGVWVETGPSGNDERFRFQETSRDDGSVYLIDRSRNVSIQLDLNKRWVLYQDSSSPGRRPIYEITAAN
jgi:hypothetical protein